MACNCLEEGWNLLQKLEGGEDKSLLKQCLTEEIFQKLKGDNVIFVFFLILEIQLEKQTSAQNGMFEIIRMGVENPDSKVGVCAPDPEAYSVFAALFNPIIEKWHLGFTSSSHHPESDYGPAETKFSNLDVNSEFIVSTRIRCCRNLKGLLRKSFPSANNSFDRIQVYSVVEWRRIQRN